MPDLLVFRVLFPKENSRGWTAVISFKLQIYYRNHVSGLFSRGAKGGNPPDHCRMMGDSPNDPGVANAWNSSDARGAHEDRPHCGA